MTNPNSERPLATTALSTMGTLLSGPAPRDAVHLAAFSAQIDGAHALVAATPVGYADGKVSTVITPHIGVIDPFLKYPVPVGSYVWVLLYPGQITEVRHTFDHPVLDKEETVVHATTHLHWIENLLCYVAEAELEIVIDPDQLLSMVDMTKEDALRKISDQAATCGLEAEDLLEVFDRYMEGRDPRPIEVDSFSHDGELTPYIWVYCVIARGIDPSDSQLQTIKRMWKDEGYGEDQGLVEISCCF